MLSGDNPDGKHRGLWGLNQLQQVSSVFYWQQPKSKAPEDSVLCEAGKAAQKSLLASSDEASEAKKSWPARMEVNPGAPRWENNLVSLSLKNKGPFYSFLVSSSLSDFWSLHSGWLWSRWKHRGDRVFFTSGPDIKLIFILWLWYQDELWVLLCCSYSYLVSCCSALCLLF